MLDLESSTDDSCVDDPDVRLGIDCAGFCATDPDTDDEYVHADPIHQHRHVLRRVDARVAHRGPTDRAALRGGPP